MASGILALVPWGDAQILLEHHLFPPHACPSQDPTYHDPFAVQDVEQLDADARVDVEGEGFADVALLGMGMR